MLCPFVPSDLLRIFQIEASVESDQTFEVSEQELLERKRQNVESILQAYRFTGISFSNLFQSGSLVSTELVCWLY